MKKIYYGVFCSLALTACMISVDKAVDLSKGKVVEKEQSRNLPTEASKSNGLVSDGVNTEGAGKVAVRFNLPEDLIFEESAPALGTQSFHTQATIDDVSGALLTVTTARLKEPLSREFKKEEINSNARILIHKIPVGTVHVGIQLLDQKKKVLVEDSKEVKVKANEVTPVEFNLVLVNEAPKPGQQTGSLAVSVNVKEETALFGQLKARQPFAQPGESVAFQINEVNGDVVRYRFDPGDGTPEKTSPDPVAQHVYTLPGKYKARVKMEGPGGKSFQDEILIIVKGTTASTPTPQIFKSPLPTDLNPSPSPTPISSSNPVLGNTPETK